MRSLKHPIKVLGSGELTTKLTVHAHRFSAKAVELIEAAGGSVVLVGPQPDPDAKPKKRRAKAPTAEAQEQPEAEAAPKPKQKKAPKAEQAEPEAAAEAEEAPAEPEPAAEAEQAPAEDEPVAEATDAGDDEDETTRLGARELPQRLARPRPSHEAAVHGGDAGRLPAGLAPAGAGRQP